MDYLKWLEEHAGLIIFDGIIFGALVFWVGTGIYNHYHNSSETTPTTSNSSSTGTDGSSAPASSDNGLDVNGCYTPDTVRSHENTNGCVDFNVGYTFRDRAGTVFIDQLTNYTAGVEVYIPYNSAAASIDLSQLQGKNIKATGPISDYNGAPQVTVTELSQIGIYQ